jgi:putative colanic acid biosynthesis acetyltransferase WcaF
MRDPAIPLAIDPAANHAARKYTHAEMVRRVLWRVGQWLIRLSPRPCFAWRRMILRLFGATVGREVRIYASTHLYMPWNVELGDWAALGEGVLIYSLGKVRVGPNVTVSYRSHVCAGTHDLNDPALPLLKLPVILEDGAWIGTDAFVGPGVTVGCGAVVGARAVVVKGVAPFAIVAGNPARVIGERVLR